MKGFNKAAYKIPASAIYTLTKFYMKWHAIHCATTVLVLALATLGDMTKVTIGPICVISPKVAKASTVTVVAHCIAIHFLENFAM
jgi:hypothetical protein